MQNLPLNNENSKGCIRIQIDSPRNFGLIKTLPSVPVVPINHGVTVVVRHQADKHERGL